MTVEPADLRRDTQVVAGSEPGLYRASLPKAWSFVTPSGGVLMAVALRAMSEALGDESLEVVSATSVFCEPVGAGELDIRVKVLRHGRVATQVRAAISSAGTEGPGLEVSATFTRRRAAFEVVGAERPEVLPVEQARPSSERNTRMAFFGNFEDRIAAGHMWWEKDWSPGPARYARWLRYLVPPVDAEGRMFPYALPPMADLMPPALLQKLGPDQPRFLAPSLDLTVHFFEPTPRPWVLVYGRCTRATGGNASTNVELWDDEGRLLAYATQVMIIRRWPKGSPR